MGAKMELPVSNQQAGSMATASQVRIAAYESAMQAMENFAGESGLTGTAYDSAKTYCQGMFLPLFKAAILFEEELVKAGSDLPSRYVSEVAEESLDQDVLESQIASYDQTIDSQNQALTEANKQKDVAASTKSSIQNAITAAQDKRHELQDKLNKLLAFYSSSATIFDNLPGLAAALDQALSLMTEGFANFNGSFVLPSPDRMTWTQTVETAWESKKAVEAAFQKVMDKLDSGEELTPEDIQAVQAYLERYPSRNIPQALRSHLEEAVQQADPILKARLDQAKADQASGSLSQTAFNGLWAGAMLGFMKQAGNQTGAQTVAMPAAKQSAGSSGGSSGFWDFLFGHTNTLEHSKKTDWSTGWLYSTYAKYSTTVEEDDPGIFKYKTNNGIFNGVAVDLGVASVDIDASDWKLNASPQISVGGYHIGVNGSVGLNTDTGWLPMPEINLSLHAGTEQHDTGAGLKVSTDIWNGMVGVYGVDSNISKDSNGNKTVNSVETGAQTVNGLEVAAVVVAVTVAPVVALPALALA